MFRVVTPKFDQQYSRWTDALNQAKSLIPQCKSLLEDIRIYDEEEIIWVYSRSHKYPQYIGAGTYNRLANLFLQEMLEEEQE
ncbi:MAG: hypothetical protein QNJ34_21465 [Xenococcaceae cyanobacterium MO_188.B29]|nr:hypothetical protein [Xenococcaceae cyanobacterium MO_188.B29]